MMRSKQFMLTLTATMFILSKKVVTDKGLEFGDNKLWIFVVVFVCQPIAPRYYFDGVETKNGWFLEIYVMTLPLISIL